MRGDGPLKNQATLDRKLIPQKVRALYMQAPVSNLTIIAIATLFFFVLRGRLDAYYLGLWTLLMIAAAVLRLLLWWRYKLRQETQSEEAWLHIYTGASVLVGVSWGLIQLFMGDFSDLVVVVALFMLILGVLSSAVSILHPHLPAFVGYCVPQVAVLGIALILHNDPTLSALALAMLFYLVMLTLFARNAHRQFLSAHELMLQNDELVERLHVENSQREEIIQERTRTLEETNVLLQEQNEEREQAQNALRAQKKSLQEMAHHDALTGLPNRLLLSDRLSQSIMRAQRDPTSCAILFIDLDHFKQINDSLGHSAGDELLKAVATRLLGLVRKVDTVARLGGDEFILLIEDIKDLDAVRRLAANILDSFATPFEIDDNAFTIGASIGISLFPDDGDDLESLLRNADSAMYRAKSDGRGAYRFYSSEMTEQARNRLAIQADLQVALDQGQLQLFYQPQVSLADGAVVGAEALLRWNHPELGLVMPGAFIHVAEESSLINRIGLWVLEEGCRQLKQWQDGEVENFVLAVNLSGREFWNNPLSENVDVVLQETGCSPHMLELEITESSLVRRPDLSRELLLALRDRGISIAVDDFGTGYSSLSYLKQYPISKLKIDQSFVRDTATDTDDQAIVRAVIALGHSLELIVTGEGVETETQAAFLRSEGCDLAQGYLYAEPLPAKEFERLCLGQRYPVSR